MFVCRGGGPGNTLFFGGVANGSTLGPDCVMETRWGQGALELASQANDGVYPMHTLHSMEQT